MSNYRTENRTFNRKRYYLANATLSKTTAKNIASDARKKYNISVRIIKQGMRYDIWFELKKVK